MCSPLIVLRGQAALRCTMVGILLAAAPVIARAQSTVPPSPSSPGQAVALLKWCWEHRDPDRYRELFTADFRFVTTSDPDSVWTRDQEVSAAAALFGSGVPRQAGADLITLELLGDPVPGSAYLPGRPYPWHQQLLVPDVRLRVYRQDGSILTGSGRTFFYLVRGDFADIPQEMRDRGFVPDSTRWYIDRWEDEPDSALIVDRAPVVRIPPVAALVSVGVPLTIDVMASDPDDDPITSMSYEGPSGASFVPAPDHRSGRLTWTPTLQDAGARRLSFLASNRLIGSASTSVQVTTIPQPPVASLVVNPTAGNPPLLVRLDASGSRDPDGTITGYRFTFGDGSIVVTQTTPVVDHVYQQGTFRPFVVALDNSGNASSPADATISVNRYPIARMTLSPTTGSEPLLVEFDCSASRDSEGPIASYKIDFGDGSPPETSATALFRHTYRAGTWSPQLEVRDPEGLTGGVSTSLTVLGDRPPVITAPEFVTGAVDNEILFAVTAADPDNEPVTSLVAEGPSGSNFMVRSDNGAGTFRWTPPDTGRFTVRFTASNDQTGTAETVLLVSQQIDLGPNLARNPSFETDGAFWNSYAGATLERVVGEAHHGTVGMRVTGPALMNGSFGVNDSPDQVRWTLGAGIHYRYTAWVRSPSSHGTAKLKIREYLISTGAKLGEATSAGVQLSPEWQMLTLDYLTTAANSTLDFQVRDWPIAPSEVFFTDDIAIRNITAPGAGTGMAKWYRGEDPVAIAPRLVPSPIRHSGTLTFLTTEPGGLRVEILDLAGRRMRKLIDERDAPAGLYELTIGPGGGEGPRLQAGVYFYRIEAREGARSGRFVILP
jgi:PKD repeat protein